MDKSDRQPEYAEIKAKLDGFLPPLDKVARPLESKNKSGDGDE